MSHIRRLSACATAALLTGMLGASVMPGVAAGRATPGAHVLMDESNGPSVQGVVEGGQVTRLQHAVNHFPGALPTGAVASTRAGASTGGGPEVFGFVQNGEVTSDAWQTDLRFNLLSTIAYDAIDVNYDGTFIETGDAGWQGWTSQQATNLFNAAHAAGDRVVATFAYLCGTAACDAGINSLLTTPSYESTFVSNVVAQVESRGVDGVNIDFEPDAGLGGEATQFTALMRQLDSALPAGDELSVDTYASAYQGGEMWDIASLAPVVSAIDVMTYGLYSGPNAQPNDPLAGPYPYTDTSVVNGYLAEMPASKLVLGIPYYGVTYSTTATGFGAPLATSPNVTNPYYSTIQYELASCALPDLSQSYDTTSQTAWASWSFPPNSNCTNFGTLRELYYDNAQSLEARYALVNSDHLRGIGIWAFGMDSGSDDLWNAIATSFDLDLLSGPPTGLSAVSMASNQATLSWTPPADATADQVSGYSVTTCNDQGVQVGSAQSVAGASTSTTTVTGLSDGAPWFFQIAAVDASGTGTAAASNSVTPLSGVAPSAALTAVSSGQYVLPNSDGSTWQVMDESNLAFTITPSSSENVLSSANADLWTFNAGYNQDIGIQVTPGAGSPVVAAWKESGGFAGTFSPNAAFVETVYPMSAGTTYTVQIVWKTNKAAIGATIAAGAGPIGSSFSPTRLTADVLPAGYQSVVSTQQYSSVNSNGSTWSELDATHLVTTAFAPSSPESVVVSGNADLWTANAGYNQDLGTFVSVNGATPVLVAWKESGGFAGTFSPNAAFVQAVYPMTAGNSYVFSLWWKANKPTNGTIFVGAGPIGSAYSPTRLTVYPLPTNSAPDQWATAVSTQQYSSVNSNGSTWAEMDPTNLATPAIAIGSEGTVETVLVSGNADLWTANSGYNQDVGIEVSVNGATPVLVAWKESGGFAGTYSPNAAFVQAVYTMEPGNSYVFSLWWKANRPANATIYVGAGPIGSAFSPTRLTVVPQL